MNSLRKLFQTIQEDIIGTDNRWIAMAWLSAVAGVVGIGLYLNSASMSFMGVADSRERHVNLEHPVEIKRILVIPGQEVKKGDLLIELSQADLNQRIRSLQSQLDKLHAELKVRQRLNSIVNNSSQHDSSDPLAVEIEEKQSELAYLENQKKNLYIFADISGVIGAVNFRKGETAPSLSALITISPESPSFVQGFVNENLHAKIVVGQTVHVASLTGGHELDGKIASVGSRIIELPARVLRVPTMKVWGREVIVELPPNNGLLLGERVEIRPKFAFLGLSTAEAAGAEAKPQVDTDPHEIVLPNGRISRLAFEPSGLVYLSDLRKFLVVSDDTDHDNTPYLFLMDRDGVVDDEPLLIPNLDEMADMESVSTSGSFVYVMSGQSVSRKGKDKKFRDYFVRMKRSGLTLSGTEKVELKPLLLEAIRQTKDTELKSLFAGADLSQIEIESHWVNGNSLSIGLKTPQVLASTALILEIKDFDSLFTEKTIRPGNLRLARKISMPDSGHQHRLSDMTMIQGRLYLSSVCHKENCGAVWQVSGEGKEAHAEMLQFYKGLNPEGIALDPEDSTLLVTFDQGQEKAVFARVPLHLTAP